MIHPNGKIYVCFLLISGAASVARPLILYSTPSQYIPKTMIAKLAGPGEKIMQRSSKYCYRCGGLNLPKTHYYLDNFTKRFCAMRCRSVGKAEMEQQNGMPELRV
jgi:hypothetical protein